MTAEKRFISFPSKYDYPKSRFSPFNDIFLFKNLIFETLLYLCNNSTLRPDIMCVIIQVSVTVINHRATLQIRVDKFSLLRSFAPKA